MAHIQKRGAGRWRARYRGPDGIERSKTFERKTDAERWLAANEVAKARGDWIDPRAGRCTFEEWADQWKTALVDLRPATRDRDLRILRVHLVPRFGRMPLINISTTSVSRFISDLLTDGRHAPATVRKIGQVLSKVMRDSVVAGLIARSPCDGIRLPPEGRREMAFLTPAEVSDLATAVGPDWEDLVLTAAFTGLRWGELVGLKVGRLDLDRRSISVVEQVVEVSGQFEWGPPKTAAGRRVVALPAALVDMLAVRLKRPEVICSSLVFPTPLGEPIRRSNFARRVWAPAVHALGLDGLRFHDLRHTAVAMAISQGAHPKTLQQRMGHSSITVTLDRYGHLYEGLDARVAEGLNDLLVPLRDGPEIAAAPQPSLERQ